MVWPSFRWASVCSLVPVTIEGGDECVGVKGSCLPGLVKGWYLVTMACRP